MELREVVSGQDAQDVVDIMRESLQSIMDDDLGFVDFRKVTGMSKSKQSVAFIDALKKLSDSQGRKVFGTNELRDLSEKLRLKVDHFDDFLGDLNFQGYLLSRGNRKWELYR